MTDIQELTQRITKLEDMLNQHLQEGAVRNVHIQTLSGAVTRLEHTVYGNGKEGLTTIIARTDEKLTGVIKSVNELPETIRQQIDVAISAALKKPEEKKLSPADSAWKWFSDRVLPYFVTGAFIILLQAVWELTKMKLNAP